MNSLTTKHPSSFSTINIWNMVLVFYTRENLAENVLNSTINKVISTTYNLLIKVKKLIKKIKKHHT